MGANYVGEVHCSKLPNTPALKAMVDQRVGDWIRGCDWVDQAEVSYCVFFHRNPFNPLHTEIGCSITVTSREQAASGSGFGSDPEGALRNCLSAIRPHPVPKRDGSTLGSVA
ncbi:MAG: hypothetical protein NDJ90_13940 [Oligoflexia bacterium]|nr:hypothetical protein [Oligoflexia bacterium]